MQDEQSQQLQGGLSGGAASDQRSGSLPPLAPKKALEADGSGATKAKGMKHSRSLNSDKFDALLMAATGTRLERSRRLCLLMH